MSLPSITFENNQVLCAFDGEFGESAHVRPCPSQMDHTLLDRIWTEPRAEALFSCATSRPAILACWRKHN